MTDESIVKIRIEQYIRCCEDNRHLDTGLWQISSINVTVAGIMLGLSLQYLTGFYRVIPLSLALLLSLALTVTISKYIFFQLGRAQFMRLIEKEFGVESVPTSTEETANFLKRLNVEVDTPARWFKQRKANRWLIGIMLIITIMLLLMIFVNPFLPAYR